MAALARLGIAVDPRAVNFVSGIRAGLAFAPFIVARLALGWPLLTITALAAYLTCLCDSGGPIRARVLPTLSCAIGGAVLLPLAGLARAAGPVEAVAFGTIALFGTSLLRLYGQPMLVVGNLLGVAVILGVDAPLPLDQAPPLGLAFLAGGLWSALLTLVVWRIYPSRPARVALAAAFRALAALTADLADLLRRQVHAPVAWEEHARAHRRGVRDAIEAARTTLAGSVRRSGPGSNRSDQGLIRLEVAEQLFGSLIALSDLLEYERDEARRARVWRVLRRARPMLRVIAAGIVVDHVRAVPTLERVVAEMQADAQRLPEADPLRAIEEQMIERIRIAVTLTVPANFVPSAGPGGKMPPLGQRLLGPLRANMTLQSLPMRHALRLAALLLPALTATMIWYGPFEHWLTITLLVTIQPYFAQTFTRALERIGGTVLGGLVAAVIGALLTSQAALSAVMVLLLIAAISLRFVNFGLFIAVLTPMIVLLVETGQPGAGSEWAIAAERAAFTVAGGLLALAGASLLWPSWEPARLGAEARRAIEAHRAYARAVLDAMAGAGDTALLDTTRRAAGLASNNLEASLSRALIEPARRGGERLEAALLVDASLRRLAGRLSVFQMRPRQPGAAVPLRAWRDWVDVALASLSDDQAGAAPSRPSTDGLDPVTRDGLTRIARQTELLARGCARL